MNNSESLASNSEDRDVLHVEVKRKGLTEHGTLSLEVEEVLINGESVPFEMRGSTITFKLMDCTLPWSVPEPVKWTGPRDG